MPRQALRSAPNAIFTEGVVNGKQQVQRRFLRKRGAAGVPAPRGGAVAQRLRGFESAEPEKTVKRSSRRTGVNLQFFPVQPSSLGLKGASSPFFVAPARRNRWHFSGSLLVSKENIPRPLLFPLTQFYATIPVTKIVWRNAHALLCCPHGGLHRPGLAADPSEMVRRTRRCRPLLCAVYLPAGEPGAH